MSQEQAFFKSRQQLPAIKTLFKGAAEEGQRIDPVEREVFGWLLALGHALTASFVDAQGDASCRPRSANTRTIASTCTTTSIR